MSVETFSGPRTVTPRTPLRTAESSNCFVIKIDTGRPVKVTLGSSRENPKRPNEFLRSHEIKKTWLLNDSALKKNRIMNSRYSLFSIISVLIIIWN